MFSILKALEDDLRLTPEQQPAWQSYSTKVTALADDISRERSRSQAAAQVKASQRIDRSVDLVRNRLAALEDIAEAARKPYAGFTPQQQGIADPRLASIVEEIAYEASAFTALERRAR